MPRGIGLNWRYDEAKMQNRLWTPNNMGSRRPLHWLDYQNDFLTMSGTQITQVQPKNGRNLNTWSAKSGGTNPTLTTRNGFKVARFDGTQAMTHIASSVSGFQNCTFIFAGYMISGGNNEDVVLGFGTVPPQSGVGRWLYRAPNSTTMGMAGWSIDISTSTQQWDIAGTSPHIFASRKINQAVIFDRDGTLSANTATFPSATPNTISPIICIGGINGLGGSNAYGTNMDFFELLAWEYELTNYEYQIAQAYLCYKYNFPITAINPFANRPPLIGD